MTDIEVEALLTQVALGTVTAKTAIALLVLKGEDRDQAARLTFYALGGRDATEVGPDGRARYAGSGKLVSEVERAIAEALGERALG